VAIGFLAGGVTVTSAWAGAALTPVPDEPAPAATATSAAVAAPAPAPAKRTKRTAKTSATTAVSLQDPASLPDGQVLAGAAKNSIEPRPADYGGTWEKSPEKCATLSENGVQMLLEDPPGMGDHLAAAGSPWPENPNCIYMGGFGLGPMNPVSSWDQDLGLWVRAIALRDRNGDDLVMAVLDGEGWFWDYGSKCTDCGIKQLTAQLAADADLGLKAEDIVIAATHAHSAPDFIGGWGFVPDWYMKQVSETITKTIRDAVATMRPAVLEYGERTARPFNRERRDTYRSAEEQQLAWLRAYAPAETTTTRRKARKSRRSSSATTTSAGQTIATVGAYAAHATTFGTNDGEAHPDWPGLFEAELEERFGGVGMHFMTGLGNMSAAGLEHVDDPDHKTGADDLAGLIAAVGNGNTVDQPDIKSTRKTWVQPVTNVPLTALGTPGFFDRKFVQGPSTVQTGEDPDKFQCTSAGPTSAEVPASAARIGNEIAVTGSPGEIFSNFSNTMKEQSNAAVTLPLGQANDALGYMPQSFEMSPIGQQGLGFTDASGYVFVNYEDSYAIDKCFGDMALETTIGMQRQLAAAK
jgi:hypothetical protein